MNASQTTTRTVYCYSDASAIGEIEMTDKQFGQYIAYADRDTGAIKLSDLMAYGCEYTASEIMDGGTTVYVD